MMRSPFITLLAWIGLGTLLWAQSPEPPLLSYSITGYIPSSNLPSENATAAMGHREVQRVLLDIAAEPREPEYVEKLLAGSGVTVKDMVENGSLRLENGRYWLNFSLLTRADQEVMRKVAGRYSDSLAAALLERRAELEKLLDKYDAPSVDRGQLAFIVVGCAALDWGGLALTTAKGYRAAPPARKKGKFFFMAEETGGLSPKEIYWGGSLSMNGKYQFLTFGDHYSPRADLRPVVADGKKIGAMMFALREGPQTDEQLAAAARMNRAAAGPVIKQMVEIGWVDRDGPMYVSRIPVLTSRDLDIVSGVLKVCNEVMAAWLDENYAQIREELAGITPLRQKVPYDQTFDQVWHYVFGMTNRKLVRAGLFADPYAVGQKRPGYFSAIFDASATPKF